MGVDYTANYGIGVKILMPDEVEDEYEYMEDICETEKIDLEYFEVGEGTYSGETNDYYICFKYSFKEGIPALEHKIKLFKQHLEENNVTYQGEIDLVGGLQIW